MSVFLQFPILQYSLGVCKERFQTYTETDYIALHQWSIRQSLVGVIFSGLQNLPAKNQPQKQLAMRWAMETEHIRGLNKKVNATTAKLTQLFESHGHKAVVLKGFANALYYPEPLTRQTGDIDFLIPGGREAVASLLKNTDLLKIAKFNSYHAEFKFDGIDVELHFIATSSFSPKHNQCLQQFLLAESTQSHFVPEGFYVPSIRYALVMQLSHIKQHVFGSGIGLRQLVDYNQLLRASTKEERKTVASQLEKCGLKNMASAIMWVLEQTLNLDKDLMLCKPDSRHGKQLLHIMQNGNFGWYAKDYKQHVIMRWLKDRIRFVKLLPFDFNESLWHEIRYWNETIRLVPKRIKMHRLALGKR